jgi:hypothetical protein
VAGDRSLPGAVGLARGAWNAALARGHGYEPQPLGARMSATSVEGYFVDLMAKTHDESEPSSLLPADLAQLALGWGERLLAGDPGAGERLTELAELLAAAAVEAPDGLRWPYGLAVPKYGLAPPWYSAMAQGQAASVFVRALRHTGDDRYRHLASAAIGPLLVEGESDLVTQTPGGPILEEAPSEPRSHILNGWIYALWGVFDVAVGLGDARARRRFDDSAGCLAELLPRYDVGWWTRYSLFPHRLSDLAKPFYHRLHCTQVEVLWRLTSLEPFARAAERWQRYDRWPNRCAAIAQ